MRSHQRLLKVSPGVPESGTGRPPTERLEQLGGRIEGGVPMVDFVEETHYSFALEPMPASAG